MPFATTLPKAHWDVGPGRSSPASAAPGRSATPTQGAPPSLDEHVRRWVGEALPIIQAAWSRAAIHRLEPYVSARLRDHLASELAALRRDGVINRVEDTRLREVTLLSASSSSPVVEVVFTARDWLADMTSGAVVDGSQSASADFRQRWHLVPSGQGRWLLDAVKPA